MNAKTHRMTALLTINSFLSWHITFPAKVYILHSCSMLPFHLLGAQRGAWRSQHCTPTPVTGSRRIRGCRKTECMQGGARESPAVLTP
ncbi:hypothetical protein E2C01_033824 [Portunus trituberculatus]|uniref:Uncharacterized protein n=1 Tax=Portunus trituberculatus TaxID=210409 RepID=A0A5B7F538_PORTR|nr:hypothetical protein [Portunus trituberculatus]